MSKLSRFPTLAALLLLGPAACGDDGATMVDAMPPDANPRCLEAVDHSDLAWIQENVFTPSCSRFTACHQGRALMANELSLEDGDAHAQLVGVASVEENADGMLRVAPGDPENSYLMVLLGYYGSDHPAIGDGGLMPYNSPLLCDEMQEAVKRWIEAGALDN